jgi:hypothetical protein
MKHFTCIYAPGKPEVVVQHCSFVTKGGELEWDPEILVWVDNDDHKTAAEFYTFRKFIRKGVKLKLFINPPIGKEEAFDFLIGKIPIVGIQINDSSEHALLISETA